MQKLITKYGLAAHLAILAVAPLFLSPSAVLWLAGLTAIWVIMEPSRVGDEMLHGARARVRRELLVDALFWVMLVWTILVGFRALNDGVAMAYDAENGKWYIASAAVSIFPGTTANCGFREFADSLALMVLFAGLRHALGKSARYMTVFLASFIVGAIGIGYFWTFSSGDRMLIWMAKCSITRPDFIGTVFWMFAIGSLVSMEACLERRWYKALPLAVVGLFGNALAAFTFSPAPMTAIFALVLIIMLIYSIVYIRLKVGAKELAFLLMTLAVLTFVGLTIVEKVPTAILKLKTDFYSTWAIFPAGYHAAREALSKIALEVWKGHPWIGSGLGSFGIDIRFIADDFFYDIVSSSQQQPLNAYWQILAERGVVGAFLLVVPLVMALITYIRRAIGGFKSALPHPLCWAALLIVAVVLTEAAYDCTVLRAGMFPAVMTFFALGAGSFAKEMKHGG